MVVGTQKFNIFMDLLGSFSFLCMNKGWLRNKKDEYVSEGSVEEKNQFIEIY